MCGYGNVFTIDSCSIIVFSSIDRTLLSLMTIPRCGRMKTLNNTFPAITAAATIFTLAVVVFASTTATTIYPVSATTPSGLELESQPVWDEQAASTSVIPINETHRVATFIGNGTMTVPDTEETVNMTNNGTAFISPVPGYTDTVSASGREYVFSKDDNDTSAITFHEIIRYDPQTFEGNGLVIAVFDNNATGSLAPFNGMMVVGTHEEDPSTRTSTITLWQWESRIPIAQPPPVNTTTGMEESPAASPTMNTTTATTPTTGAIDANTTGAGNGEQQQQQQTTTTIPPTALMQ